MKYQPIIAGFVSFLLFWGFLYFNKVHYSIAFLLIIMIGFFNGLIIQKDFTRSVVVFFIIGLVLAIGLFFWGGNYWIFNPDPETNDRPIDEESSNRAFIPNLGYGLVLAIYALALLFFTVLLTPAMWISGLLGSITRTKYQSMKKENS